MTAKSLPTRRLPRLQVVGLALPLLRLMRASLPLAGLLAVAACDTTSMIGAKDAEGTADGMADGMARDGGLAADVGVGDVGAATMDALPPDGAADALVAADAPVATDALVAVDASVAADAAVTADASVTADGLPAPDDAATAGGRDAASTPPTHPPLTSAVQLDLLFLVDDSTSMAPLQAKMRAHMAEFMNVLKNLPGGLPDLHIAVVSSSLGAGAFGNVPSCQPTSSGNLQGNFQHAPGCTQLHPGATFLTSSSDTVSGARVNNFDGDITDAFSCISNLGDKGCGFEHQLAATRLALEQARVAGNENSGFLRDFAYLGIVILTNEDDCSAPPDSLLFDPAQNSVLDPLGGLQSYRCNEFGHLCDGQMPPHGVDGLPRTFTSCVSNEKGPLTPVKDFVDFLFTLKPGSPEKIFVGAIAGPPTPYTVDVRTATVANGGSESQPVIQHSCTSGTGGSEFADPAVRIRQTIEAFGPNGVLTSICAEDFGQVMSSLATALAAVK